VTSFGDDERFFIDVERLSGSLKLAASADYWRELCSWLSVTDDPFTSASTPYQISPELARELVDQLVEEGYFQSPPIVPRAEVDRLAEAVSTVVAAGFHPLFATVYDQFWDLLSALRAVLEPLLGPGFQVVPDYWLWHVDPRSEGRGWAPHRDHQFETTARTDGRPTLITVWLPLTDATPLNSCMYVLPLSRDPRYRDGSLSECIDHLQDIRALPAEAGSVLGWNQDILHWGSRGSRRASHPRVSWGIYCQSGDVPPYWYCRPPSGRLTFEERLGFIGAALNRYSRSFPLPFPMRAFVLLTRKFLATG
jgi:hypothetical protein